MLYSSLKETTVRAIYCFAAALSSITLCGVTLSAAQTPAPKPQPDVLIFKNGDQLTGTLERAAGGNVVFKSDMAGELTISFDNIKELRSGAEFALLRKGLPVNRKTDQNRTLEPVGTVLLEQGKVTVTPHGQVVPSETTIAQAPVTEPTSSVAYLVDRKSYDQQIARKASFKDGWNGTLTGGATLVRSTTSATTLTAAVALVRAVPTVSWQPPRNRTTVDVVETYGTSSSPVIPPTTPPSPSSVVLSSIFHADSERDEYFTPTAYALADVAFDHNYAQGLQLQQIYGAGAGWTPIKSARQELDLKADIHFERQHYITTPVNGAIATTTPDTNLFGSTFWESYRRNLPRKVVLTESASYLPAWNDLTAYAANATVALSAPIFKRLSATIATTDNFLNDPAQYYRKNSYQFVTGITYALK